MVLGNLVSKILTLTGCLRAFIWLSALVLGAWPKRQNQRATLSGSKHQDSELAKRYIKVFTNSIALLALTLAGLSFVFIYFLRKHISRLNILIFILACPLIAIAVVILLLIVDENLIFRILLFAS